MRHLVLWPFLLALLAIHTIDMELTSYYIRNDWQRETFPPMSWSIRLLGIFPAVWLSRVATYSYVYLTYRLRRHDAALEVLVLVTVLYYVAMIGWLFTLGLVAWPFPPR